MASRVSALRLVAPLATATATSIPKTTATAPATDQPVPGISPTPPQRAPEMPTYYTSAGVPTQYPTPWTSPPTDQQVIAHNIMRQRVAGEAAKLVTQQQMDPATALEVAKKLFAAPASTEGSGATYEGAGDEGPPWLLIGAGVLVAGGLAWYFLK